MWCDPNSQRDKSSESEKPNAIPAVSEYSFIYTTDEEKARETFVTLTY